MKGKMRYDGGFTMTELLVVVGIIAFLGAITLLASKGIYDNYKVSGAAREIYSDMQTARIRALKENKEYALCYDPGNKSFTSYSLRNDGGADGALCTADDPAPYVKSVGLAKEYAGQGFEESFPGVKTEFNPDGTASAGNLKISGASRVLKVTVTSTTGNIRIDKIQ